MASRLQTQVQISPQRMQLCYTTLPARLPCQAPLAVLLCSLILHPQQVAHASKATAWLSGRPGALTAISQCFNK